MGLVKLSQGWSSAVKTSQVNLEQVNSSSGQVKSSWNFFLDTNLLGPKDFFDTKFFWTQDFFGLKICLEPKKIGPKIILDLQCFGPKIFVDPQVDFQLA